VRSETAWFNSNMSVVCHRCARQGGALTFRITTNHITTNRVVMFGPAAHIIRSVDVRESSDRGMLPNLNHGTDRLLSALTVMLSASRFSLTTRRMSGNF
jgi:hypothetical protein